MDSQVEPPAGNANIFNMSLVFNNATTPKYSPIFLLTKEERQYCYWVRLILNSGVAGVICGLGLIANLLSYWILCKSRTTPVATFLLRCLALTDNFFIIVWAMNNSLRDLFRYIGYHSWPWRYVRLVSFPMVYVAQSATIWLTVVLAVARFIAVSKPYSAPRLCTITNMKLVLFGVYMYAIAYNLPRFFEVKLQVVLDKKNDTIVTFTDTVIGANPTYQLVYRDVMYYIFSFGLPLALLCVLNLRLTLAYRAIKERRRRLRGSVSGRSEHEDSNITLVMIAVVAVFLACQTPARLVQIIWGYNFTSCRSLQFYLYEISNILELLNSSVNFMIYCLLRRQFRLDLHTSVCGTRSHVAVQTTERLIVSNTLTNGDVENKTEITSHV